MQNAPLPSLNLTTATPATAANLAANQARAKAASLGAGNSNDAFKQALSQQLDQRQTARHAEARTAERQAASRAAAPKPPAAPKPAQQDKTADRSAQPKPAEVARPPADNGDKTTATATAKADGANADADEANANDRAASDTQAAHAADPLADMLALVAAFNQRTEAGAAGAEAEAGTGAAGAGVAGGGTAASAVDAATLAALTAAEASAASDDSTATASATGDTRLTAAEFKAALGRAADALPPAPAADSADADADGDSGKLLRAELGSKATPTATTQAKPAGGAAAGVTATGATGATDASGAAAKADGSAAAALVSSSGNRPGTDAVLKADAGNFGQQLATARSDARAEANADAALAATDAAPTTLAATAAANAVTPEMTRVGAPAATLYSRVGTPAWDQQLGQKVIFMAAGGEHSATMELNPPDLGPLQVVLSVSKDQATAAFTSAAPEVRQALEAALPKLREMMGEAGIQLGNATVSSGADQNAGQRTANNQGGDGSDGNRQGGPGSRLGGSGSDHQPAAITSRTVRVPDGAVDTFA